MGVMLTACSTGFRTTRNVPLDAGMTVKTWVCNAISISFSYSVYVYSGSLSLELDMIFRDFLALVVAGVEIRWPLAEGVLSGSRFLLTLEDGVFVTEGFIGVTLTIGFL